MPGTNARSLLTADETDPSMVKNVQLQGIPSYPISDIKYKVEMLMEDQPPSFTSADTIQVAVGSAVLTAAKSSPASPSSLLYQLKSKSKVVKGAMSVSQSSFSNVVTFVTALPTMAPIG